MYELKKNGKVFTSNFVGTGPSSFEKRIYPGRGFTKVEKHCSTRLSVKRNVRSQTPRKFEMHRDAEIRWETE